MSIFDEAVQYAKEHGEAMTNCPKCHNPLTCAHCVGAKGGAKSKRVITKAQQAAMQEARISKRGKSGSIIVTWDRDGVMKCQ